MMEVQPRYRYKPLRAGEIRTLWLEPGSLGEPLYGWLRCVPFSPEEVNLNAWEEENPSDESDRNPFPSDKELDATENTNQEEGDDDVSEDGQTTSWDGPSLAGYDYCAMLYAWGSSELTNMITIDDDYTVPITKSLYEALMYLRDDEFCRAFWADALCINQGDVAEKSIQVGMMGQIYAHTSSVSIWLGIGGGFDILAFSMLSTTSAPNYGQFPGWKVSEEAMAKELVSRLLDYDCTCCPTFEPTNADHAYEQALLGIRDLCCRPWFGRLWVAQEAALAPNNLWVHNGTHGMNVANLETFVNWSTEKASQRPLLTHVVSPQNLDIVANMANIRLNAIGASTPDFIDVLIQTSKLNCANPLDRIYAISALCETFLEATDYSASRVEVFGKVTRGFLRAEPSYGSMLTPHNTSSQLKVAPITRARLADCEDWPSWVPDYNNIDARCEWKLTAHSPTQVSLPIRSTDEVNHICIAGKPVGRVRSILFESDVKHSSGIGLADFFDHLEIREELDTVAFTAWT